MNQRVRGGEGERSKPFRAVDGVTGASFRHPRERGAGSVLALAAVAVTVTLTTAAIGVAGAWGARQRAGVAADAGALAAADVAVGRASGEPCDRAAQVAGANGASVRACAVDGVIVTIDVSVSYHGWEVRASARAGPPGSP
jgi:secretion/DNA translocation related TadE-like protein